ncbi:hypothetical protein Tco_0609162 [Tanacetum coccineum]
MIAIDGSVVSSPVVDENVVAVGNTKDVNVGKSVNFPTLITPAINGTDVAVPLESIRAISERFDNTIYGFFLVKLHSVLVKAFSEDRSSYDRAMIELQADVELKDTIVVVMPKLVREGFYTCNIRVKYEWKPPSGNKKEDAVSRKEVSNPNPFDVLNSFENDVDLGTNGGTLNLDCKEANSSGSSFWNVAYPGDHDGEDEVKPADNEMASFLA